MSENGGLVNGDEKRYRGEVKVYGVPKKRRQQLENIVSHLGIPLSQFLKPFIIAAIEAQPENFKNTRHID